MGYFTGLLWLMRRNAERKIAANYQLSYVANCSHDPIVVQTSVSPSRAPRVAGSCYAAMGVAYTGILVYIWATYFGCSFGKVSAGGFTTRRCVLERLKKKGKLARLPQIYRWWYDCENQQAEGQRHKQFKNLDPNPPKLKKKRGSVCTNAHKDKKMLQRKIRHQSGRRPLGENSNGRREVHPHFPTRA